MRGLHILFLLVIPSTVSAAVTALPPAPGQAGVLQRNVNGASVDCTVTIVDVVRPEILPEDGWAGIASLNVTLDPAAFDQYIFGPNTVLPPPTAAVSPELYSTFVTSPNLVPNVPQADPAGLEYSGEAISTAISISWSDVSASGFSGEFLLARIAIASLPGAPALTLEPIGPLVATIEVTSQNLMTTDTGVFMVYQAPEPTSLALGLTVAALGRGFRGRR